jgi:hypothetical protein
MKYLGNIINTKHPIYYPNAASRTENTVKSEVCQVSIMLEVWKQQLLY